MSHRIHQCKMIVPNSHCGYSVENQILQMKHKGETIRRGDGVYRGLEELTDLTSEMVTK